MKKPLDWYHSLIYANKERSEYTMEEKGSLDELLYQMYMKAHDLDGLNMSNSVKVLNVAYYLAVAIYNTPHVEEENKMDSRTSSSARKILAEEHNGECNQVSPADVFLVRWMSWAILALQKEKPAGLESFLNKYKQDISWKEDDYYDEDGEIWSQCSFITEIPKMVEQMGDKRFETDLAPNALHCVHFGDGMWTGELSNLTFEEMEQLLTFYRRKDDQHALLQWAWGMECKLAPKPSSSADDLPF